MQKNKLFIFCFVILSLFNCKNKEDKTSESTSAGEIKNDTIAVFPVTEFIKGQLHELEESPITPLQITITDNRIDSIWRKREEIRAFARPFLTPVIDSNNMQSFYNSSSFMDQTIGAITMTYKANEKLPADISLTDFNVYINPETGKVKRIFIVKKPSVDTTIQLNWIVDKGCSKITLVNPQAHNSTIKEEKMVWRLD